MKKTAKSIWEDEFDPGARILVSSPTGDFEAVVQSENPDGTLQVTTMSGAGMSVNIIDVVRKLAWHSIAARGIAVLIKTADEEEVAVDLVVIGDAEDGSVFEDIKNEIFAQWRPGDPRGYVAVIEDIVRQYTDAHGYTYRRNGDKFLVEVPELPMDKLSWLDESKPYGGDYVSPDLNDPREWKGNADGLEVGDQVMIEKDIIGFRGETVPSGSIGMVSALYAYGAGVRFEEGEITTAYGFLKKMGKKADLYDGKTWQETMRGEFGRNDAGQALYKAMRTWGQMPQTREMWDIEIRPLVEQAAQLMPNMSEQFQTAMTDIEESLDMAGDPNGVFHRLDLLIRSVNGVLASRKLAAWAGWRSANGVEVVTGRGADKFDSLEEAQTVYPTLDPERNTADFTWAMMGNDGRMRFEDWDTYKALSASKKHAITIEDAPYDESKPWGGYPSTHVKYEDKELGIVDEDDIPEMWLAGGSPSIEQYHEKVRLWFTQKWLQEGKILFAGRAGDTGTTEKDVDPKQLDMGVEVEHEHHDDCPSVDNEALATEISLDHLSELPDYYDRLKRMEEEGKAGKTAFLISNPYQGERGGKWRILDENDTVVDEANSREEAEQLLAQYEQGGKGANPNFVEDQYKKTKGAGADWESNLDTYTPPSKERWCRICDAPMGALTDAEYEQQQKLCEFCREGGGAQMLNPDLGARKIVADGDFSAAPPEAPVEQDSGKKQRWCELCQNPAGEFTSDAWESRLHLCDTCLHEGFGEAKVMDLAASKQAGMLPPEINAIMELFKQSGVEDFQTWEGMAPGEWKIAWQDDETKLPYLLTVSPKGWSFVAQDVHVQRQGFDYPPNWKDLQSVWGEARDAWEALHGNEYQGIPGMGTNPQARTVDPGSMLAGGEAAPGRYGMMANLGNAIHPVKFAAESNEELSPLHRFYQERNVAGDPQRIIVADGVMRVHEVLGKFSSFLRLMGVQFERIEATRYAGVDEHIDRGRLWLKAEIVAGAPIVRKAKLSIVLTIKDGEISDAVQFVDASQKHRLLNEEGLRAYLRLQETPAIMRAPDVERAQIDRTMLPPTPSKSLFHGRGGVDA